MRTIIAASGSGGHLFAGLSIAEMLRNRFPDIKVFFLSSGSKMSGRLIEDAGFKHYRVYAKGLLNRNLWCIIQFLFGQLASLAQSCCLLAAIRPRLVVGTGGFASFGIILWSRLFGIPAVIHEQNVIPGKANRLLGPIVNKILVSFEESKEYFKGCRCIVTGMPTRFKERQDKEGSRIRLGLAPDRFTVLVMGGSRGAHSINRLIIDAIKKMPEYRDKMQFIHLTGMEDYKAAGEAYAQYGFKAYVESFSTKMALIYSSADLVISRSGSASISEISFFGLAAILIPYPYSMDRHQLRNAKILEEKGAAVVITEDEISHARLIDEITKFINQPERLSNASGRAESLAGKDAAKAIVEELVNV